MANISEDRSIKNFLISAIQEIEKKVGLEEIDSEETVVNMALVYLFNNFDIGLALDSSEILKDRTKFLIDLEAVAKAIEKK